MVLTVKVKDIASVIEDFAPRRWQESYDNAGLQIGNPDMEVSAVLVCLDVTERILQEAIERGCNMIVSHHPLIFKGLKELTGHTAVERIAIEAIRGDIAIYSAHTNLDSAWDGVSHEVAHILGLRNLVTLDVKQGETRVGIGVVGDLDPVPKMEFLRRLKEDFAVKGLRYAAAWPGLVVKRVAVCGGAGAYLIPAAIKAGADAIVTGDVKYHDYTTYGEDILISDIGHYESEFCTRQILSRLIKDRFPECPVFGAETEENPIQIL